MEASIGRDVGVIFVFVIISYSVILVFCVSLRSPSVCRTPFCHFLSLIAFCSPFRDFLSIVTEKWPELK